MKNSFFALVLMGSLGDVEGQGRRFFNPERRDCVQLGYERYPVDYEYSNFSDGVIALHYSHDFYRWKSLFLRSRSGMDCFIDWGFHLQTGLMAGGRLGFLEVSAGPVAHVGSYFWEQNNVGLAFTTSNEDYFKPSLNAAASVTIAKRLVLGMDWQGFKSRADVFAPDGFTIIGTRPVWVKSSAVRLGFWF